jgi:NADPH:quinone reductase-like Zn-dependent oxidoreductase
MFTLQDALAAADLTVAPGIAQWFDAAGIVRRVGSQVTDLSPGNRVIALGSGCFSTSVTVARELCARIPDELSLKDASTMPLAFSTAIYSLLDVGQLRKAQVS